MGECDASHFVLWVEVWLDAMEDRRHSNPCVIVNDPQQRGVQRALQMGDQNLIFGHVEDFSVGGQKVCISMVRWTAVHLKRMHHEDGWTAGKVPL